MFTHLHVHSNYSFLESLPSPDDLINAAIRAEMTSLALTDLGVLTGAIEFYQACLREGIKPILGLELPVDPPVDMPFGLPGNLVFLAEDRSGWRSLCRLSSDLQGGDRKAVPFERIAEEASGLICLTGGKRGPFDRLASFPEPGSAREYLERLIEVFPSGLYVELQASYEQGASQIGTLHALAKRAGLPEVACGDVHFLLPDEARLHQVLSAIRLNCRLEAVPISERLPAWGCSFINHDQMAARFVDYPQALEATLEITSRCQLELPVGKANYPELDLANDLSAEDLLRQKAQLGAAQIYGELTSQQQARLDHELSVICEYGYASLFLIMEEIIAFARKTGIPTASRGSASSSLVAHCLHITTPDPIRLNLFFERFLNPARATPPDIDMDICSRRRDELIRFVYQRFGQDRVAMVGTINRFRRRSAMREVAKAYGLTTKEISTMTGRLSYRWWRGASPRAIADSPYSDLEKDFSGERYKPIFHAARAIIGLPRHLSVHAGGVVIAPGPLTDIAPTQLAAKGILITQFDLDSVERLGLVKIDLLGIRGLTVLGDVAQAIRNERDENLKPSNRTGRITPQNALLDVLEEIPKDDPDTSETVRNGWTIGCFQIESPGMRATLKEIQAANVDDIMAALALYRPGPLSGGLKDAFVRRHLGEENVEHIHPVLSGLLGDTYGVILYQEQVLRIAHELAGLSLADSDLLRRAMSHFDPGKQMQLLKEKFIAGVFTLNQVNTETAERIWELMAAFAGYGFPKAHAASYAQVGWRAAWCKTHYPAAFMASVLANWGGYYPQQAYINEAQRMGLKVAPPHINYARRDFSVSYIDNQPVLYMGLDQVRDLTHRVQVRIIRERPFHSFTDFLVRADPRPVEAENLVRVGALEGFGLIPDLLRQLSQGTWRGGQLPLFSFEALANSGENTQEDWGLDEKLESQKKLLGAKIDAQLLIRDSIKIQAANAIGTLEAAARVGAEVRVVGLRQSWHRDFTERGSPVYIMSLGDLEGVMDVMISAEVYRRCKTAFSESGVLIVEGTIETGDASGDPYMRAKKIWRLD